MSERPNETLNNASTGRTTDPARETEQARSPRPLGRPGRPERTPGDDVKVRPDGTVAKVSTDLGRSRHTRRLPRQNP